VLTERVVTNLEARQQSTVAALPYDAAETLIMRIDYDRYWFDWSNFDYNNEFCLVAQRFIRFRL
jgi:hypothetical protein